MKKRDRERGARIKVAMQAAGYKTAKAFCQKYNLSYDTVSQHTNGRRKPRQEHLKLYSKSFGVSATWLLTGKGSPLSEDSQTHGSASKTKIKRIESSLQNTINTIEAKSAIDVRLLTIILEAISVLRKKHNLNEKACAHIASSLYNQVVQTTQNKELQEEMVNELIATDDTSQEK